MNKEWVSGQLSDIAEIIMGQSPKGDDVNSNGSGIPLLNGPTEFGSRHPIPKQFTTVGKKLAKELDLLFCVRGSTTGRMNWADQNYVIGRGLAAIRHRLEPDCQPYLRGVIEYNLPKLLVSATGSTFPNVSKDQINGLEIKIPPLPEQKAIAHILGTFDDKIELNRKMNETLEAMAQAMFKSWFVDFDPVFDNAIAQGNKIPKELKAKAKRRKAVLKSGKYKSLPKNIQKLFPASFVFNEELGKWIPDEWDTRTIGESTSVIIDHRGKTPKKMGGDWVEDGFPAISAKNIKNGSLIRPDMIRYVDQKMYNKWMKIEIEKGDIIMTSEAPMGEMFLISDDTKYCLSQRLYSIRANGVETTSSFLYYWLQSTIARSDLEGRCTGTTVTGIKQSELRKVRVLTLKKSLLYKFEELIESLRQKNNNLTKQNIGLGNQRDLLLSQLISGKTRLPKSFIKQFEDTIRHE